jgi:NADPH-dependent curcumin reductase CurA
VKDLVVGAFLESHDEMLAHVAPLVAAGRLKYREDIRHGLEAIPACFSEMLRGDNFGKMLVQLSPDPTQ